jgi:hypothetical protein
VSVEVARLMRRLGLPGVSHHTMQHTGITLMLDSGANSRAIRKLAGWMSETLCVRCFEIEARGDTHVELDSELPQGASVTAPGCTPVGIKMGSLAAYLSLSSLRRFCRGKVEPELPLIRDRVEVCVLASDAAIAKLEHVNTIARERHTVHGP